MANATVVPSNIKERVCGMKYHGIDPKKELCANHSDSCENRKKKVSMCFSSNKCDICGFCQEHCVGHKAIIGRTENSRGFAIRL